MRATALCILALCTLHISILPGAHSIPEDDFSFSFALFIIEKWIPRSFSSNISGMKYLSLHFSVFLRLVCYFFACVRVPNQITQHNSEQIGVYFAWVHEKLLIFSKDYQVPDSYPQCPLSPAKKTDVMKDTLNPLLAVEGVHPFNTGINPLPRQVIRNQKILQRGTKSKK